jgi:hypothetical protein
MTDQDDEQQNNLFEEPEDPVAQERREFLRSLGKWSQAVIGGVVLGGAVMTSQQARAVSWFNGGGGWHNRGGGWYNRGGGWANRSGGGWYNRSGGWANRGGSWANRSGGSRGGSWINRR